MTKELQDIRNLIDGGETEAAIAQLDAYIEHEADGSDEAYYLRGNAYRKRGDWQQALNNYMEAIERNPESPALSAKNMLMDILNFYNKDMYNQ